MFKEFADGSVADFHLGGSWGCCHTDGGNDGFQLSKGLSDGKVKFILINHSGWRVFVENEDGEEDWIINMHDQIFFGALTDTNLMYKFVKSVRNTGYDEGYKQCGSDLRRIIDG